MFQESEKGNKKEKKNKRRVFNYFDFVGLKINGGKKCWILKTLKILKSKYVKRQENEEI